MSADFYGKSKEAIMIKNPWIQNIWTLLLMAIILAATGIDTFAGAGIRPQKLTKWKREAKVSNPSTSPGFSLKMLDFTPRLINGSSVAEPQPEGYLAIRGPLDLRLTGTSIKEFDRSKIEYVELQGSFPKPPQAKLTKPEPRVVTSPTPPAVVIPDTASGTSSAPVMADTTTPNLLQLLENAGGHKSKSSGTLLFNKKIDGISPSGQEIYAPFVIPYDVNPPTVRFKTKATYIRE
ncbi:MAG: hypothetical protein HN996_02245 [Opitutae bacterium]|nr:hypothetical protein [Opitutae bacterium]